MSFDFTVKGFKFSVGVSFLDKKALLSFLFQMLEPPAIFALSVTALALNVNVSVSR